MSSPQKNLEEMKKVFLADEIKDIKKLSEECKEAKVLVLARNATFQRGYVYRDTNVTEKERIDIREHLEDQLKKISKKYINAATLINENTHNENIKKLAINMAKPDKYKLLLKDKRFRIGSAQKALNLYLKYLWCLGNISTPPHCTIDRLIQAKIPEYKNKRYCRTKSDCIEKYKEVIKAAHTVAKLQKPEQTLAEWELFQYQEVRISSKKKSSA